MKELEMDKELYSLKMRADCENTHVSGAEKIIEKEDVKSYAMSLLKRGLEHPRGSADFINLKLERIEQEEILYLPALPISTVDVKDAREGWEEIAARLKEIGIKRVPEIIELFQKTHSMRGAMLLDIHTLERLEKDEKRGIRATYMDWERKKGEKISEEKNHFLEAIVLATKVAHAPGIVGEICMSDDPDYVTGYISSKKIGYVRITKLKEVGNPAGGRIFLYDGEKTDVEKTIAFLEKQKVIVQNVLLPENGNSSIMDENKLSFLDHELARLRKENLYRSLKRLDSAQGSHVLWQGRDMLMLASNSYLDMISNPRVREYSKKVLEEYGAGSGGSRLTTGNTRIHEQLEEKIAKFKHAKKAIVFNTGYVANLATIAAFADKDSVIFSDELNHASIIDGCRLSRGKIVIYAHNDMEDLERKIKENLPCKGLMVSDAVFSMDGDILNLPKFVALGKKYGLITMIDEAHATGVIGATGQGIWEHFSFSCDQPDIIMGTLSKAIGSEGGYVCGDERIVEYLINKARGYIFSTSLSPATVAAAYEAFCILEEEPELVRNLQENTKFFCDMLRENGIGADSETAIVPIIIGDEGQAVLVQERLMEKGYYISAIRYPTVGKGQARLRVALMASHTKEELKEAAKTIAETIEQVKCDHREDKARL